MKIYVVIPKFSMFGRKWVKRIMMYLYNKKTKNQNEILEISTLKLTT